MKNLTLLSLLCFLFTACDKDDDEQANGTTKTDTITASSWKYEDAGLDDGRDGTMDASFSVVAPSLVPPCRTDNSLTFTKDNSGTVDEGSTKCINADAQTTSYNWNFADNEGSVVISNNSFGVLNGKSKILSLTSTQLILSRDTVVASRDMAVIVKLKH